MKWRLTGAALTLSLALIPPAFAQTADGPLAQPAQLSKGLVQEAAPKAPKGVRREIGYQNGKDTIVGSLPLSEKASLDVGVFSVARHKSKQPSLSRYDLMKDVYGNSQHIPAVSLSIRF